MSFTLKVNQSDIKRISDKLTKTIQAAQRKGSALYKFKVELLNDYKDAVVSVMGEIHGEDGGSMASEYFMGKSFTVDWMPLSANTREKKSLSGWSMYIWEATGSTKNSVKVIESEGFAGIKQTDPNWQKAINVEYGDVGWPSRALFTLATDLFRSKKAEIMKIVKSKFIETAIEQGWGKN